VCSRGGPGDPLDFRLFWRFSWQEIRKTRVSGLENMTKSGKIDTVTHF
jgi:hypothetical protein